MTTWSLVMVDHTCTCRCARNTECSVPCNGRCVAVGCCGCQVEAWRCGFRLLYSCGMALEAKKRCQVCPMSTTLSLCGVWLCLEARSLTNSCGVFGSSRCPPDTSLHLMSFYRAFFCVSTASDERYPSPPPPPLPLICRPPSNLSTDTFPSPHPH